MTKTTSLCLLEKNKAYLGAGPSVRTTDASKGRLIITKSLEVISNLAMAAALFNYSSK